MAGVSTKEIKNRIRSMESTKQITKAMEMVAASKLRRAQAQVMDSRPYFEILHQTITDISVSTQDFSSVYFQEPGQAKVMFVVIAGDRGLAGGYNSNVLKLVEEQLRGQQAEVLPIGKKAVDFFRSRGYFQSIRAQGFLPQPGHSRVYGELRGGRLRVHRRLLLHCEAAVQGIPGWHIQPGSCGLYQL